MEFFENEQTYSNNIPNTHSKAEKKRFILKAYMYMAGGLTLSFVLALLESVYFAEIITGGVAIFLIIAELAVALIFSFTFKKMSKLTAFILYFIYAGLTGLSFGSVFLYFEMKTISLCFIITAVLFTVMALIGHFSDWDMSGLGKYLLGALFGVIVMSIIGAIFHLTWLTIFITCIAIAVFMGLTAYDSKKLSAMYEESYGVTEKLCLLGAFQLYLDFINLFLYILRLLAIIQNDN